MMRGHGFGGGPAYRTEAETRADEAVERYQTAITFIWESIDKKSGQMKARWRGGKTYTLPQLIDREKEERKQLPVLFGWPIREAGTPGLGKTGIRETGPRAGTYAPGK
jgi:hypothetical protein